MISVLAVIYLTVTHWIADFIFQTDEMAQGKSSSNKHLTDHIVMYTGITIFMWFILALLTGATISLVGTLLAIIAIFSTHWVTDYFTSRENTRLWKDGKVHDLFVNVGFDQVLHVIQYILIYQYIFTI